MADENEEPNSPDLAEEAEIEQTAGTDPGADSIHPAEFDQAGVEEEAIDEMLKSSIIDPPHEDGDLGTIDRFRIIRLIGAGGMGVVLLAVDSNSGAKVAIKAMKPDCITDPRLRHAFIKEANHMKEIRHEHVLPVTEVSDRREGPYYVMPYIEGGSLAGKARPGRPVNLKRLLPVLIQVAEALSYAHDKHGVVHRDVKPENVLLDPDGDAYLCDFGLVRTMFNDTIIPSQRKIGWTIGTRPYMAPEVVEGNAGDYRVDVYSFGAMIYEMVTGHRPYTGSNTEEIFAKIKLGPPVPVRERNPELPEAWAILIEGAMNRELRGRYAQMQDVLEDLIRIRDGEMPLGPGQAASGSKPPDRSRSGGLGWLGKAALAVVILGAITAGVMFGPDLMRPEDKPHDDQTRPVNPGPPGEKIQKPKPETITREEALQKLGDAIQHEDYVAAEKYARELDRIDPGELERAAQNWPIIEAARKSDLGLFKVLVYAKNSALGARDQRGYQAIHVAAEHGNTAVLEFLANELGFDVNAQAGVSKRSPLHIAIENDQADVVDLLSDLGADPNVSDNRNRTPLHLAAETDRVAMAERLLTQFPSSEAGGTAVNVNAIDNKELTPLHLAADKCNLRLVNLLLQYGADPVGVDWEGNTPLDLAETAACDDAVIQILKAN